MSLLLALLGGVRRAIVTWAEFEVPVAPRRAIIAWAELEVPVAPRRAIVTWVELEVPVAPRRAIITWAELEVPAAADPNARRAILTWAELEVPSNGGGGRPRHRVLVVDNSRRAVITWAELRLPDPPVVPSAALADPDALRPRARDDQLSDDDLMLMLALLEAL